MPTFRAGSSAQRVQQKGRLRVGVLSDVPGFSHRRAETGRLEGIDVELSKLLAQGIFGGTPASAADSIEYVETSCALRERVLEDDAVDAVIGTYAISDRRRLRVDFSKPYFGSSLGALANAHARRLEPGDLATATICVVENTVGQEYVQRHGLGSRVVAVETDREMVNAVHDLRADLAIASSCVLDGFAAEDPSAFSRLPWSFSNVPYAVGIRKGNDELRSALDARLDELLESGVLVQLANRRFARRAAAPAPV